MHLCYRELNSLYTEVLKLYTYAIWKFTIFVSELGQFSPQHRCGLDAGDTDSVDLTPDNHGPHRMIVNKQQTSAKMVTKYLNYYIWCVRIVRKVILIQQHLPNINCCVSCSRRWRHLPILERIPIGKLSKTRKLSIRTNGEFAQNTLPEVFWLWVIWNVFRSYSVECATVSVILP